MSRPIGANFHVPHGMSNAMLVPAVTAFSLPHATKRYATVPAPRCPSSEYRLVEWLAYGYRGKTGMAAGRVLRSTAERLGCGRRAARSGCAARA